MNKESDTYNTCDLYLAAFLRAKGIKLIEVDGPEKKARFRFENTKETHKLAKGFYKNAQVGITDYNHSLRDFKSMLFNRG